MLGQGHMHVCLHMSHVNSSIHCGQGKKGELIPRSVLPMRQCLLLVHCLLLVSPLPTLEDCI